MEIDAWTWVALLGLGAIHGVNPGMGWLFAAALGLQEGKAAAVWRALPPLALGHALSIAVVLALGGLLGVVVPVYTMKWIVAAILVSFGIRKLVRQRHPRYGGMRITWRQLAVWSFLMASAHGAGLMVLPLTIEESTRTESAVFASQDAHAGHMQRTEPNAIHAGSDTHATHMAGVLANLSESQEVGALATIVHTIGYLLFTTALAWLVYAKLGVRILKSAWLNVDTIWAFALIATGLVTPLI